MVYVIGVVGYEKEVDEAAIWEQLSNLLDIATKGVKEKVLVMTKLVDLPGVNRTAYYYAKQRGWNTGGIACQKAYGQKWLHMSDDGDFLKLVGDTWGDESEEFVNRCDVLVRIGTDKQSSKEMKLAQRRGIRILTNNTGE